MSEKTTQIVEYRIENYEDLKYFLNLYHLDPAVAEIHFSPDYSEVYYAGEQASVKVWAEIPYIEPPAKNKRVKSK
jgi:hypothetical protein